MDGTDGKGRFRAPFGATHNRNIQHGAFQKVCRLLLAREVETIKLWTIIVQHISNETFMKSRSVMYIFG